MCQDHTLDTIARMSGVTNHFLIAAKVHSTAQHGAVSLAKNPWLGSSEAPGMNLLVLFLLIGHRIKLSSSFLSFYTHRLRKFSQLIIKIPCAVTGQRTKQIYISPPSFRDHHRRRGRKIGGPELREDWSKTVSSGPGRTAALINSQQLRIPAHHQEN